MNHKRWIKYTFVVVLVLCLAAAAAAVGVREDLRERVWGFGRDVLEWVGLAEAPPQEGEVYWCPMHPQIKRSRPETCPICNMALVPLEEGGRAEGYQGLILTARHVQQAGVVTEPVMKRRLFREIDTTGRIVYDERRLAKITSWVFGRSRLEKLHVNFTGERVEKGQLLAELFSTPLIIAQDELLIAMRKRSSVVGDTMVDATRRKLRYQGLSEAQVDRVIETGRVLERVPVHAPINGTVIDRRVAEGEYVNEGGVLLEVADLSQLWLFVDVYEEELPLVSVGQQVELTVRALPGEVFEGEVAFIDPVVQPDSRTVRVRLNIDNGSGKLKPGMYARARMTMELEPMLAVPSDAVLWSGRRNIVIVKEGEGRFRPVEVKLGRKWLYPLTPDPDANRGLTFGGEGRQYQQVLDGLSLGDEVVAAGAFLLNAESQFQSVLTKLLPPRSVSATLEELLGAELAGRMLHLLTAYHELSESLADDQLDAVAPRAGGVADAARQLSASAMKAGEHELAESATRVMRAAERVVAAAPRDLKAARTAFAAISRATVGLLAEHGGRSLLGEDLFVFECPMAGDFGFKLWLQPREQMRNPYMGQKMLTCGKQLQMLQP